MITILSKKKVYSLGKLNSKELYNILSFGNYLRLYLNPKVLIGKILSVTI